MERFLASLIIIRPLNCLMAMAGVYLGAHLTWLSPVYYPVVVSMVAVFFICASGNIFNDLADIDSDRINHPNRVLVKGRLSKQYVIRFGIILNLIGLILSAFVNLFVLGLAVVATVLLFWYNLGAKKIVLLGNLIIAVLAGLLFITGGMAVDWKLTLHLPGPLIGGVLAFFFHLVREIVKDCQDIEGDFQNYIKTLPQIIGLQRAVALVMALFFVMVLFSYIPIIWGWYGFWFKIITVYIVDLPVLAFLIFLWGNPTPKMLSYGSTLLKIGMLGGMVALFLT